MQVTFDTALVDFSPGQFKTWMEKVAVEFYLRLHRMLFCLKCNNGAWPQAHVCSIKALLTKISFCNNYPVFLLRPFTKVKKRTCAWKPTNLRLHALQSFFVNTKKTYFKGRAIIWRMLFSNHLRYHVGRFYLNVFDASHLVKKQYTQYKISSQAIKVQNLRKSLARI